MKLDYRETEGYKYDFLTHLKRCSYLIEIFKVIASLKKSRLWCNQQTDHLLFSAAAVWQWGSSCLRLLTWLMYAQWYALWPFSCMNVSNNHHYAPTSGDYNKHIYLYFLTDMHCVCVLEAWHMDFPPHETFVIGMILFFIRFGWWPTVQTVFPT